MDHFKQLVDAAPDAMIVVGADGIIQYANRETEKLFGHRPEELIGKSHDILIPERFREAHKGHTERFIAAPRTRPMGVCMDLTGLTKDGREVPIEVSLGVLHTDEGTLISSAIRDVTPQRLAQDALRLSEAKYRELIEHAPEGIVLLEPSGRTLDANRATCRLLGYTKEELLSKTLFEMVAPQDMPKLLELRQRPRIPGTAYTVEWSLIRKDGSLAPMEISAIILPNLNSQAFIRDMSERRMLEASVRRNAERLAGALEAMDEPLAVSDADDKLVAYNSAYLHLTGLPGPLHGQRRSDIVKAMLPHFMLDEQQRARILAEVRDNPHPAERMRELRFRDGRTFRLTVRRTPDGGSVAHFTDMTEDMRVAEELREAQRNAEAASAAKTEFLSSMSHELRTPFNAILGFAQLLYRDKREPLSVRQRERVDQILKGADHLLHLIDDVLDLSRIEAGRVSISIEAVAISDVIDEVIASLRPAAERAGVRVARGDVPEEVTFIQADRTRFAQILVNFGMNAVKYNRPGGSVKFSASLQGSEIRITVSDTGIGVPPDKQDKLFQPFQRAGQEAGPIEGTGIGLAISRRLAELMNGTVGFRSVVHEGSDFWVNLPAHGATTRRSLTPRSLRDAKATDLPLSSRTVILYIEDNAANVAFMRDLLGSYAEVDLATAATAEMGLEIARARRPKVILMDINLPGMSGLDALQVLRAWPETKDIPVIALTAAAQERDRRIGEAAGFYRYLAKPLKIEELEDALEKIFHHAS